MKLSYVQSAGPADPLINPLEQAQRLMRLHTPYCRPPWNSLLAALARGNICLETAGRGVDDKIQDILAWNKIRSTVNEMHSATVKLDLAGFRWICIGYEKTVTASAELVDVPSLHPLHPTLHGNIGTILESGLSFVKRNFANIVSGESTYRKSEIKNKDALRNLIPRLLEVPVPAQLQPFIRVLGLRGDHEGLVELMEWMSYYAPEIQATADEVMNGGQMLRRCLTAARVFLEQSPSAMDQCVPSGGVNELSASKESTKASREDCAAESRIQRFRRIVDQNPAWGGWPTDEEVDRYVNRP